RRDGTRRAGKLNGRAQAVTGFKIWPNSSRSNRRRTMAGKPAQSGRMDRMGYRREIVRAACIAALWIGSTAAANAAFFGFGERSAPGAHRQPRQGLVLAQVADPRVLALEEQVRSLSGQVEELNFLLLQLQEQMRKMQEDNEYRFQQLEGGGATTQQRSEAEPSPATPDPASP